MDLYTLPKNNLFIRIRTEPATASTVYVWLLFTYSKSGPEIIHTVHTVYQYTFSICSNRGKRSLYSEIQVIFGTVYQEKARKHTVIYKVITNNH